MTLLAALRNKSTTLVGSEQNVYQWTVVLVNNHYKNPAKNVGIVQSWHHHHLAKKKVPVSCSRHDIADK